MSRARAIRKSFAARAYRRTAEIVEPLIPTALRTPAHYWSRRITNRLEAEYDALMSMVSPGDTVVDVGANIGIFTYGFLARGAHVHAIEPQPACASQIAAFYRAGLPRTAGAIARGRLSLHVEAVSNQRGSATLYIPMKNGKLDDESASLERDEEDSISIDVPVRTIDDYAMNHVRVIKIDVEGREVPALEGASGTIRRCRPSLLVEIEQRHHSEPIGTVFSRIHAIIGKGYSSFYLGAGATLRPIADFDVDRDQLAHSDNPLASGYVRNFFFLNDQVRTRALTGT